MLELRQPVCAPEGLIVHHHKGRAAHALLQRAVAVGLELGLDGGIGGIARHRIARQPLLGGKGFKYGQFGDVAVLREIGRKTAMQPRCSLRGQVALQADEHPRGLISGNGKRLRLHKRHAQKARRARNVDAGIVAFERLIDQRFRSCRLEHRPEQHRHPLDVAQVARGNGLDLRARQVGIGRRKIEEKSNRADGHGSLQ